MAESRGGILPIPNSDEEVEHIPWPGGGRLPRGVPVQKIDFSKGFSWNGPTTKDLPSVPKPMQKTETIHVPANLPEIQTVDPAININFIARLLSSVLMQPRSFTTGNMTCGLANRGYQLPDTPIPVWHRVVVKAWFTNAGTIYVAYRQSSAQSVAVAWPLVPNESISYYIPNVNGIWIMATVANEGASFTVEQS